MNPGGDVRAPGGAITLALCGSWEHEGPCPRAPHHTDAARSGSEVRLRIVFAVEPAGEAEIRADIDRALSGGGLDGPDGVHTSWELVSSGAEELGESERALGRRLAGI
jgi:hypothetical protein